ncbi:glycosyltransferase [Candidatus Woesearchaeota archaeon]|nr:glycosyltransferase [Candidatus Woesearchaeota archaeon]
MTYTLNDYTPLENLINKYERDGTFGDRKWQEQAKVSVVVTTYNQREQLRMQLLALCQQTYDPRNIEVVVVDDGGKRGSEGSLNMVAEMDFPFDVKYVWQPDSGFRAAKARNEAIKRATHEIIISIDSDMIMSHDYVEEVMKRHYAAQQMGISLITAQDRAFVEPEDMTDEYISERRLDEVEKSTSRRFGTKEDWRKPLYQITKRLKQIPDTFDDPSYTIGSSIPGGNCSFNKGDAFEAGLFDEDFKTYGKEDSEFGLRLYEHFNHKLGKKLFFVPVDVTAYHLEHGGRVDHTKQDKVRQFFFDKVAAARDKEVSSIPEVSVYIPCYNQERFIENAIRSVARQKFDTSKLEVVIGEDGSTDRTKEIISRLQDEYQGRLNIRIVNDGNNYGRAENTNRTIQQCRGKYIVQLDADDELLPEAVNTLYQQMQRDAGISLAFGDCIDRDVSTGKTKPHWSCNEFTPQWYRAEEGRTNQKIIMGILQEGMRIHHPRMFRRDAFLRTGGIDSSLENAIDYDLMMKIAEQGMPLHIKKPLYVYNINHGENTTSAGALQRANAKVVLNYSLNKGSRPRKEVYLVDEGKGKRRTKSYDLNNPLGRADILFETWKEQEGKKGTALYNGLIRELENVVSFFRWVTPKVGETALQRLLQLERDSVLGNYFAASYRHQEGRHMQALQAINRIKQKGSSARALERVINEALEGVATA